jgi:hypothetical protein
MMVIKKGFLGWGFFFPENRVTPDAEAVSQALEGPCFFDHYWEAKDYAEARGLEVLNNGCVIQVPAMKLAA